VYSRPGAYFVTYCTYLRRHTFESISNGRVWLSEFGHLAEQAWRNLPEHFPDVYLDKHVVMPNHFHGIVFLGINPDGTGTRPDIALGCRTNLGKVMNGLKSTVTRLGNRQSDTPGARLLQDDYYDHILRGADDLDPTRQYVLDNPRQWELDRENPLRVGLHPIYGLLEKLPSSRNTALFQSGPPMGGPYESK
jgi:putative transposase